MLSRWQEQECSWVYFNVLWEHLPELSGSGCRKTPRCQLAHPVPYPAMRAPCSFPPKAWVRHGANSCHCWLSGQRGCQRGKAFPPWLVIAGGGGSLLQWGGMCWRGAWKELALATATAVHPSGFPGCGLVFLKQDWWHKVGWSYVDWRWLWTWHESGHHGEPVATAYVSPQRQGRLCQPRVKLIQVTSMARKFDADKLTDSALQLFLLPIHLEL